MESFNEKVERSVRNVIRPISEKLEDQGQIESAYGKDLVVSIPFDGEVKLKAIMVAAGDDGSAPGKVHIYKNVDSVDINIIEERKPVQTVDLN